MGIGNTNFNTFRGSKSNSDDDDSSSSSSPTLSQIGSKVRNFFTDLGPSHGFNKNSTNIGDPGTYKKGGKVKKTGMAKVHKGEEVLTKKQAKKYDARKKGPRKA